MRSKWNTPDTASGRRGRIIPLFLAGKRLQPECLQAGQVTLRLDVEQKIQ